MKKSSALLVGKRNQIFGVVFIVVLLTLVALGVKYVFQIKPKAAGANCKYLISMDRNGTVSPSSLATDLNRIESQEKMPYNGLVFRIPAAESLMSPGTVLDLTTVEGQLAPLAGMVSKPNKLKHNFVRVLLKFPGDFFDADAEWTRIANNFAVLSQALKNLRTAGFGVDGIAFDNEGPYSGNTCAGGMWNYPSSGDQVQSCITHSEKTLVEYQNKVRARGKQVMDRVLSSSSFSDIRILTYLDSYYSCVTSTEPYYSHNFEMLGSFTLGMLESTKGTSAKVIDGGEYSYNAGGDQNAFIRRYNYRKTGMPADAVGCPFIRNAEAGGSQYPDFSTYWADTISVAHGLYNDVQNPGDTPIYAHPQTSDNIRDAVHYALENSDEYVWFYTENVNGLDHSATTYITDRWNDPIWDARTIDIPNDPICDGGGPTPSPSPSTSLSPPSPSPSPPPPSPSPSPSCTPPAAPNALTATKNAANPTGAIDLAWIDNTADHDGFWFWRSTTAGVFPDNPSITLPDSNMRNYTNTGSIQPDTLYYYKLESYKGSCFSTPLYAQAKTDPVGVVLNISIQLQGRTNWSTTNIHLKIYDAASALILDKPDVTTNAAGNAQITLPTSMTVGGTYSFYLKPKYFLADYKSGQILANPMNLTYAAFKTGDSNDDNIINTADYQILLANWYGTSEAADFNKDGVVNTGDFAWMSKNWLQGS